MKYQQMQRQSNGNYKKTKEIQKITEKKKDVPLQWCMQNIKKSSIYTIRVPYIEQFFKNIITLLDENYKCADWGTSKTTSILNSRK